MSDKQKEEKRKSGWQIFVYYLPQRHVDQKGNNTSTESISSNYLCFFWFGRKPQHKHSSYKLVCQSSIVNTSVYNTLSLKDQIHNKKCHHILHIFIESRLTLHLPETNGLSFKSLAYLFLSSPLPQLFIEGNLRKWCTNGVILYSQFFIVFFFKFDL